VPAAAETRSVNLADHGRGLLPRIERPALVSTWQPDVVCRPLGRFREASHPARCGRTGRGVSENGTFGMSGNLLDPHQGGRPGYESPGICGHANVPLVGVGTSDHRQWPNLSSSGRRPRRRVRRGLRSTRTTSFQGGTPSAGGQRCGTSIVLAPIPLARTMRSGRRAGRLHFVHREQGTTKGPATSTRARPSLLFFFSKVIIDGACWGTGRAWDPRRD